MILKKNAHRTLLFCKNLVYYILYPYFYPQENEKSQEIMNQEVKKQPNPNPHILYHYRVPVFTRILLLLAVTAGAILTARMPDVLTASVCAACTAGVFAFYYLTTFSPVVALTAIPAYAIAFFMTGSAFDAAWSLLFLPVGAMLSLCLLRRTQKTSAVVTAASAIGISAAVLFLIGYMAENGTVAPDSLMESFNARFESARAQLLASTEASVQAAIEQNPLYAQYYTDAYVSSVVNASIDTMKLSMPAVLIIIAEVLGFLAVTIFCGLTKLFRCTKLLPRGYRIRLSRLSGVIFVVSYLINLFSSGGTATTLTQVTAGNLASVLMPGLFLLGLRTLVRRAKNPGRRRSFVVTIVILGLLLFTYPSYAVLFVVLDGLGEVFFDGHMIF